MLFSSLVGVFLGALTCAYAQDAEGITKAEFEKTITANDVTLAVFIKPYTIPTTRFLEAWAQVPKDVHIPNIIVDCTKSQDLCDSQSVNSYPAIRIFHGSLDNYHRYRGPLNTESITGLAIRSRLPVITTVASNDFEMFKTLDRTVFLAYLPAEEPEDGEIRKSIVDFATENRHSYIFGITTDPELARAENLTPPVFVAYKTEEDDAVTLALPSIPILMESFAKDESKPLIGEYNYRNENDYRQSQKIIGYSFAYSESERIALRKHFNGLAKKYFETINFVVTDANKLGHIMVNLGVWGRPAPIFILHSTWKDQTFAYVESGEVPFEGGAGSFDVEKVEAFILDVLNEKREPDPKYVPPAPPPAPDLEQEQKEEQEQAEQITPAGNQAYATATATATGEGEKKHDEL